MPNDADKFVVRSDIKDVFKTQSENIIFTSGIDNQHLEEVKPELETTTAEKFLKGHSNSIIILGKDRPAGISSGNGGKGKSGAAAIDIVVGLMGSRPIEKVAGGTIRCQKDFHNDSARIYISQMTDLDNYFKIPTFQALFLRPTPPGISNKKPFAFGAPLENIKDTSGVGIKADHVRVVARENIKLVTSHSGVNSQSRSVTKDGIYLIAGYDSLVSNPELQLEPMVKGNKLVKFLEIMLNAVQNVHANLCQFMQTQHNFNQALAKHRHVCGAAGSPSHFMISDDTTRAAIEFEARLKPESLYITVKNELLKQHLHSSGKDYILSKWHKLN